MQKHYKIITSTINDQFEVAVAEPNETEEIMSLLIETAEWLKSKGSTQWNGLLNGYDSHDTAHAIQQGNVFIFKKDTDIAGLVMLLSKPSKWDIQLWEDRAHDTDGAVYLHRLAVGRKYASTGLGQSILNWCTHGITFTDKELMRLDCVAENDILNSFYTRNGYVYVGEKDGYSKYEKAFEN